MSTFYNSDLGYFQSSDSGPASPSPQENRSRVKCKIRIRLPVPFDTTVSLFEPTCAHAQWALMRCLPSVRL